MNDKELLQLLREADFECTVEEILREEQEAEDMEAEARSNYIKEAFEW